MLRNKLLSAGLVCVAVLSLLVGLPAGAFAQSAAPIAGSARGPPRKSGGRRIPFRQQGRHCPRSCPTPGAAAPPAPPVAPPPGQTFAPPPFIHFTNQTLRQIVHTSIGGSRARVVLSNAYGTAPVTIGAAHIALRDKEDAIQAASAGR